MNIKKTITLTILLAIATFAIAQSSGGYVKNLKSNPSQSAKLKPKSTAMTEEKRQRIIDNLIKNMVLVEGGSFMMGNNIVKSEDMNEDEERSLDDATPVHKVTLSPFYIGKYEVTQLEWEAVMGNNPSYFKGQNRPVEQVTWYHCIEFIDKLNKLTRMKFRLPTEAEWEFAARGGNKSHGFKYPGSNHALEVAWYDPTNAIMSKETTHDVGLKKCNELGLYDMGGNVSEWCSDRYGPYSDEAQENPNGPQSGDMRVLRGGVFYSDESGCITCSRNYRRPDWPERMMGLRLAK